VARSGLLNLLPDFSEGQTAPRQHPSGFEPLVHAALSKEEFSTLGMPVGFMGGGNPRAKSTPSRSWPEPKPAISTISADLPTLTAPDTDRPDLEGELADILGGLESPEMASDSLEPLSAETDMASPSLAGLDDVDIAAADAIAAHEALEAAHREEIERLQEAHREALNSLLTEAIPKVKQEVADALATDLAPLMAGRLRAGLVDTTLEALRQKMAELLDDASALSFDLRGPEYLISAFLDAWSGDASQVRAIADDGVDLVARIDRTVIATRLSELDRLIEEAVA
jgi:hypothetical protein